MIKLQPIKIEELNELENMANAIWRECYTTLLGINQVEYMTENFQSREVFLSQIDNGYEYFFLENEGIIVGYLGMQEEKGSIFLSKLYLKGVFHGRGMAQEVLKILTQIAVDRNLNSLYLTVNKRNVKAIKAYERFGFIKTDDIVTDIGEGFVMDDYVYTYYIK